VARDIRIARPFCLNGSNGRMYEYGIGYYPQVADHIADHWYAQWHTQSQVLARGGWLMQRRWLFNAVGAFNGPAMIWIGRPENSAMYGSDIVAGYAPIFFTDLQHFPDLEHPLPDAIPLWTDATGVTWYRMNQTPTVPLRRQPLPEPPDTIRVWPGDPDPPIVAASDANCGRDRREEHRHRWHQMTQQRVINAEAARYIDVPNDPVPIPWPQPRDLSDFTYRDPRDPRDPPASATPPQLQPSASERPVMDYDIANEITRARLERRPVQQWAR
jgi:hypothetical protein